ncbi:MAG: phosphoenolpyruvate synthase [Anaerolineae bacterium]
MASSDSGKFVYWFEQTSNRDVALVGGKNASLGEMITTLKGEGIRVPDGFATSAGAYWHFLQANDLTDQIRCQLDAFARGESTLNRTGRWIRSRFLRAHFPEDLAEPIRAAYHELSRRYGTEDVDVAVRSSATAEDLPDSSFAGQQETFLNVRGEDELLIACRRCLASLFTDRAIAYRQARGFDHMEVALSVGVQKMVRSDKAGAGVLFTIDTETGFPDVIVINAGWGLGENVVKGVITPDEYRVFKPLLGRDSLVPIVEKTLGEKEHKLIYAIGGTESTRNVDTTTTERRSYVLSEPEILQLATWGATIEQHYARPMDVEWAKDGDSGELYIVQARPETVQSRREANSLRTYALKQRGEPLLSGLAIGEAIAVGKAQVIRRVEDIDRFEDNAILVTEMTDPDWVAIMRRASAIVTDHGGRTSHAAIVSRELGIPAIVGTGTATSVIGDGQDITVSCAEGERGYVYPGILDFEARDVDLAGVPQTRTPIMMNISSPAAAFRWWRLPARGIGLARMEFVINNVIKIHPMALVHYDRLEDAQAKKQIADLTREYEDKSQYFVDNLARGIASIAASQYPHPVIVRMSDFKTNEYAQLIGGAQFEPHEENPMIGWRGASRYYSPGYRDGFALECRAIRKAREEIGMDNVIVMIPFCRTVEEADKVLEVMAASGLRRGEKGLRVYVMCEIPSNVVLADLFARRFDGFSIGSNDLTQLVLGVDRDSTQLAHLFDERNEAVKRMIATVIDMAHGAGAVVGICGEAPSNYPEYGPFLVEHGIDSISLEPDSIIAVTRRIAETEARQIQPAAV